MPRVLNLIGFVEHAREGASVLVAMAQDIEQTILMEQESIAQKNVGYVMAKELVPLVMVLVADKYYNIFRQVTRDRLISSIVE